MERAREARFGRLTMYIACMERDIYIYTYIEREIEREREARLGRRPL